MTEMYLMISQLSHLVYIMREGLLKVVKNVTQIKFRLKCDCATTNGFVEHSNGGQMRDFKSI